MSAPTAVWRSPDWICAEAERVKAGLAEQERSWSRGFTRRSFLAGSGMVLAASLGSQLVTTRHAYAAEGTGKTLVVIFLRGALDGLATVVPANDPNYRAARPVIGIPDSQLLQLDATFGLHPSLSPLLPLWTSDKLAFVHSVGARDSNRDHFASQSIIERGTATLSSSDGWLDRVLAKDGPGTTFRAVCEGPSVVEALKASRDAVAMRGIDSLTFNNPSLKISDALRTLYTGLDAPVGALMEHTLTAVAESGPIKATPKAPQNGASYPANAFGDALADVVRLVRSNCGLRAATVDLGGWDLHSEAGTVTAGAQTSHLTELGRALSAYTTDLGARIADVTTVVVSEFGRRVEQNSSGGTDHGYGGLMLLLGGAVRGGQVHGAWPGLAAASLTSGGDLEIRNDYRDVLGEVALKALNLGDTGGIFPGYTVDPLGVMR